MIWNLHNRRYQDLPDDTGGEGVSLVTFAPEGTVLAVVRSRKVQLIDPVDGHLIRTVMSNGATTVAFSPTGRLLAVGTREGGVIVWDVATGIERHEFAAGVVTGVSKMIPLAVLMCWAIAGLLHWFRSRVPLQAAD